MYSIAKGVFTLTNWPPYVSIPSENYYFNVSTTKLRDYNVIVTYSDSFILGLLYVLLCLCYQNFVDITLRNLNSVNCQFLLRMQYQHFASDWLELHYHSVPAINDTFKKGCDDLVEPHTSIHKRTRCSHWQLLELCLIILLKIITNVSLLATNVLLIVQT